MWVITADILTMESFWKTTNNSYLLHLIKASITLFATRDTRGADDALSTETPFIIHMCDSLFECLIRRQIYLPNSIYTFTFPAQYPTATPTRARRPHGFQPTSRTSKTSTTTLDPLNSKGPVSPRHFSERQIIIAEFNSCNEVSDRQHLFIHEDVFVSARCH